MAFYHKEYTVNGERTFYHRFTCGKCGKTTDWMANTIEAEYKTRISAKFRQPSDGEVQSLLRSGIEKELRDRVETIKRGAERGYYFTQPPYTKEGHGYNLIGTCPFCGQQPQVKGNTTSAVIICGLMGLVVGFIAFIVVMASSNAYTLSEMIPSIIAFVAPTLIGCAIGFCLGRKDDKKGVAHTHVEYSWGGKPQV